VLAELCQFDHVGIGQHDLSFDPQEDGGPRQGPRAKILAVRPYLQ
jgi:hypothetical protein